jgi:neutral ceramidase
MRTGFAEVRLDDCCEFRMGGTFTFYMSSQVQFHTPLFASAWAVEAGESSFIWVSADVARFAEEDADRIREDISERTGLPFDQVLVSATHTHSGPTARPSISPYFPSTDLSYFEKFGKKIAEAGVQAWNNIGEAYISYGRCNENKCVHNRRYFMESGESMMEPGGPEFPGRLMKEGPEDSELQVIWFMKEKEYDVNRIEKPLGIIVNYSSHPSELYNLPYLSADFPGVMRRILKAVYGDIPVIYLQGCCGNLTPRDHESDASWGHYIDGTERVGTVLAADVMRIMSLVRERSDVSDIRIKTAKCRLNLREVTDGDIKKSNEVFELLEKDRAAFDALDVKDKAFANKVRNLLKKHEKGSFEDVPISAVRLDDIIFLTNPAELFCEYQLDIKKRLGPKTVCVELTNGGICYIGTKQAYLLGGYEVNSGFYDYYAGSVIEESLIKLAAELGRNEPPKKPFSKAD